MTRRRPARRLGARELQRIGGVRPQRVDLHTHTDRSDGAGSPDEVLASALRNGLTWLAIVDHDVEPALPAGRHSGGGAALQLIHGAEVSGLYAGRERHLLVYFPGEMPETFRFFLRGRAAARALRYDAAASALGLPAADPAAHRGERALTRQHLARALVAERKVSTVDGAFRGPLRVGEAVPFVDIDLVDVISIALAAGGLPVWAHPSEDDLDAHLPALCAAGLRGVEAHRPSLSQNVRQSIARKALEHGILVTAGSDYHGLPQQRLGRFSVRPEEVGPFFVALGLDPSAGA